MAAKASLRQISCSRGRVTDTFTKIHSEFSKHQEHSSSYGRNSLIHAHGSLLMFIKDTLSIDAKIAICYLYLIKVYLIKKPSPNASECWLFDTFAASELELWLSYSIPSRNNQYARL